MSCSQIDVMSLLWAQILKVLFSLQCGTHIPAILTNQILPNTKVLHRYYLSINILQGFHIPVSQD